MKNNVSDYADILIINDASVDETPAIAKRNNVRCISFVYNLGYGNALQAGYKYAKDYLYDYVIQMDADGQHDVSNVFNIYKELSLSSDHPDIVLSCRFMDESKHYEAGFFKKIAHVWLRFLMKLCSGIYFPDSTTGLQGLSRNAVTEIQCGEICMVSGIPDINIGDTLCPAGMPDPMPMIKIEEPTLSILSSCWLTRRKDRCRRPASFCRSRWRSVFVRS